MSYTYPEALAALEAIANDYIKLLRPLNSAPVMIICDVHAKTASVTWDVYHVRVTMPVRAAASVMTQAEFEDWTAYLLHELGHPTHTSQTVWHTAVRNGHARMLNAVEDVRMEQALIASGIVRNAKAVLSRLISRKVAEARAGDWKPNARKEIGWTICVLGRAANGYALDPADIAWIHSQIKSGSTVETVLGWALPELAACTSTADCLALAERINAAIAAPPAMADTRQPQGQQGQQGDEGDEGDEGDAESGDEGQGTGAGGAGEGDEGDEGEGEGDTAGGDEKATSDAPSKSDGPSEGEEGGEAQGGKGGKANNGTGATDDPDEIPVTDESDLTERSLSPEGDRMDGSNAAANNEKMVIDILRDGVMTSQPKERAPAQRLTVGGARMRDAAAKASRQRALLARALRANEQDEREGGRKAGRLDRRALSRAVAGAVNVFERRDISEGFDTDVCVLLDASGSMSGCNMDSALEAGLVIAQAAGSVGASCTTEIFNSTGYIRAGALASKRAPNIADFAKLSNEASGGTPLSAHMARVAVSQAKRAGHKRRVVFVVTDGGCDYGPGTVKRMADYLGKTYGTVLAHVSIGTPLTGAFKAEVRVDYGQPISEVGVDHFVKVLQAL